MLWQLRTYAIEYTLRLSRWGPDHEENSKYHKKPMSRDGGLQACPIDEVI